MPELPDLLFYAFAGLTLLCGFLVVANPFRRNPVTSAMFLVLMIISLAGLFVLLHAFFLAAVQILVYAGAIMVLFLFVVMLLNAPREETEFDERTHPLLRPGPMWLGAALALAFSASWAQAQYVAVVGANSPATNLTAEQLSNVFAMRLKAHGIDRTALMSCPFRRHTQTPPTGRHQT